MRMKDITVEHMRTVICIADQGGFTAAADVLGQSQSSLSRVVAMVEKSAGARLFDRTTRSVTLTELGAEFVHTARHIVETYDRSINHFVSYLSGPNGKLRIATLPSLAATLLPPFIHRFHHAFPHATVDLLDLKAADIIDLCRDGTVDLAVTAEDAELFNTLPGSFHFTPVASEGFACILPSEHELARQETVAWTDLAGQSFISFTGTSSVRRITDRVLSAAGIVPAQTVSAGTISAVAGLCAAGLGISAVPGFVIPMTRVAGVTIRPLAPLAGAGPVTRRVGVLQDASRPRTPAVDEFVSLLKTFDGDAGSLPEFTRWGAGEASRTRGAAPSM
ncbi:LysR family transcriptional regulator [Corynebacterium variabile]|uniref:LysR family transcriptional regulator n=1 Tax=Corynebacterium variabile TaxID=1727 RepID=UPI002896E6B5|nr:LysR family transcriptional regulator [Corynebacterium variabile]